jgi:hypothetical protein|tara:strand:- start:1524 stop:1883 length:360 start_codon:yes stop_codon:yes gene_type:complete
MNRYTTVLVWMVLCLVSVLFTWKCTNSPSGAFEHNTTSYFINGKFHDLIPDSIIRKTYGFVINEQNGNQHSYRVFKGIENYGRETLYCTAHKHWEVVTAYWQSQEEGFKYGVQTHRKSR